MLLQVWLIPLRAKVLIKAPLKVKIIFPPIGHLRFLDPRKAHPKILQGSLSKVPLRVLRKASPMVKVLLRPPFLHLPPTSHLRAVLADHEFFLSIPLASITFPVASLGILSGSPSGALILISVFPFSLSHHVFSFPVTLLCLLYRYLSSSSHSSPDLSSWPAWAYCPARRLYLPFTLPSLSPLSFFSFPSPFLPLPPPSFSSLFLRPPLPCPFSFRFLSRCLPKVASPNVAAPLGSPSPKW